MRQRKPSPATNDGVIDRSAAEDPRAFIRHGINAIQVKCKSRSQDDDPFGDVEFMVEMFRDYNHFLTNQNAKPTNVMLPYYVKKRLKNLTADYPSLTMRYMILYALHQTFPELFYDVV